MKKFVQITSGRGPIECCRVVDLVLKEIIRYSTLHDIDIRVVEVEEAQEKNCYYSAVLELNAPENVISEMIKEWSGSVKYISTKNPYRPHHGRKNWFVGVNFFSESDMLDISDKDIRYETMRASGPGGQNVNKVETAVRAVHIPSGTSVVSTEQRNQHQNKVIAREKLILKLTKEHEQKLKEDERTIWMNHNTLERGNPVKIFKGEL